MLYNELYPITEKEREDLQKIAAQTSASSYYEDESGNKFSISDIVTGKVKMPAKYRSASKADEISDPNYGIKNVRGTGGNE